MFERDHHQRIAAILRSLDESMLLKNRCLFGGGTAIALASGEYRESVNIDLICSSVDGYRDIREQVNIQDQSWLFKQPVQIVREPRVDRFGIRMMVGVDGVAIKIDILFAGQIDLDEPLSDDVIEGVWTLTKEDLVATKLMANADRYADDSVMSCDLIDLAMLSENGDLPEIGISKARRAYGESIDKAFTRGKELLLERDGHLVKCMSAMKMKMEPDVLLKRVQRLHLDTVGQKQKPVKPR